MVPAAGDTLEVFNLPGLAPVLPSTAPLLFPDGDEKSLGDRRVVEEEDGCRVVEGEGDLMTWAPPEDRGVVVGGLIGLKLTVTVPDPSSSSSIPIPSSLLSLRLSLDGPPSYRRSPCLPRRFETNCNSKQSIAIIEMFPEVVMRRSNRNER